MAPGFLKAVLAHREWEEFPKPEHAKDTNPKSSALHNSRQLSSHGQKDRVNGGIFIIHTPRGAITDQHFDTYVQTLARPLRPSRWLACGSRGKRDSPWLWRRASPPFPCPGAKSSRQTDAVSTRTGHDPPTGRGAMGRFDKRNRFAEAASAMKLSKKHVKAGSGTKKSVTDARKK